MYDARACRYNTRIHLCHSLLQGPGGLERDRLETGALVARTSLARTHAAMDDALFVLMQSGLPPFPVLASVDVDRVRRDMPRTVCAIASRLYLDAVLVTPREALPELLLPDARRLVAMRGEFVHTVHAMTAVLAGTVAVTTAHRITLSLDVRAAIWKHMVPWPAIEVQAQLQPLPRVAMSTVTDMRDAEGPFWHELDAALEQAAPLPTAARERFVLEAKEHTSSTSSTSRRNLTMRLEAFLRAVVPPQTLLADVDEARVRAAFEERFAPCVRPAAPMVLRLVRHLVRLIVLFCDAHASRVSDRVLEQTHDNDNDDDEDEEEE